MSCITSKYSFCSSSGRLSNPVSCFSTSALSSKLEKISFIVLNANHSPSPSMTIALSISFSDKLVSISQMLLVMLFQAVVSCSLERKTSSAINCRKFSLDFASSKSASSAASVRLRSSEKKTIPFVRLSSDAGNLLFGNQDSLIPMLKFTSPAMSADCMRSL
ncbi:hypothetical protein BDF20DRAFT_886083 [Mycotypha africana]|uniref:uncharacterized protein n=1 Tax=Mycotypha africana TaxID=64632 RepID=UPI0023014272|nr:uncharacterized protein BDF20DRAFT_886083 [Mycotypha africana]KAI8971730.1 hypothetical protein BDF20DRAFT_886083 [Mycotypha africana]